jgi:hypothetical protein
MIAATTRLKWGEGKGFLPLALNQETLAFPEWPRVYQFMNLKAQSSTACVSMGV